MKKVLIPNGSFHEIPLIQELKRMGYYVITSGTAVSGVGHRYADKYISGDFSDESKMLEIAREENVDYICSNCNDFGYISSCYVAEKLGIKGHDSYNSALILHKKDKFKIFAEKINLLTPKAYNFSTVGDALSWCKGAEYPIIIKPVDLGAGQGINRADDYEQAEVYVTLAMEKSKAKRIVIEPFVEGTSHSFNAFIVNKKVVAYYSDNEYMKYSRYRVSTSASPATNAEKTDRILIEQTELIANALELTDGLVHSQYILDSDGNVHILEITRRMSGDWYPYPESKATGIDWVHWIVCSELGMDCSQIPKDAVQRGYTGRHCLNGNKKGTVIDIKIKEQFAKHIYDKIIWLKEEFVINDIEKDYPGIVFFAFDDKDEMMQILDNIGDYVELVYK